MTTWSADQVQAARSARARIELDEMYVDDQHAIAHARHRLARQLVEMCRTYAIELNPDDTTFETTEGTFGRSAILARWAPTADTELVGGHRDGEVFTFAGAPDQTLAVPRPMQSFADWVSPDRIAPEPTGGPLVYRCTGWREDERRWIYTCDTTA